MRGVGERQNAPGITLPSADFSVLPKNHRKALLAQLTATPSQSPLITQIIEQLQAAIPPSPPQPNSHRSVLPPHPSYRSAYNLTFDLIAVWPASQKQCPLLDHVAFNQIHPSVEKAEWCIVVGRWILGALESTKYNSSAIRPERGVFLSATTDSAADKIPRNARLADFYDGEAHKVFYLHLDEGFPFPKTAPKYWKQRKNSCETALSQEDKAVISNRSNGHCILTGEHLTYDTYDYAQFPPSALAPNALVDFGSYLRNIVRSFPISLRNDDVRGATLMTAHVHKAMDADALAIYVPEFEPIENSTIMRDFKLSAPTLEVHVFDIDRLHEAPLLEMAKKVNNLRAAKTPAPLYDEQHLEFHACSARPPIVDWFTEKRPWTGYHTDPPHPCLLAIHYAVFVLQRFGSRKLKKLALGEKRWSTRRGKRRLHAGAEETEEEDAKRHQKRAKLEEEEKDSGTGVDRGVDDEDSIDGDDRANTDDECDPDLEAKEQVDMKVLWWHFIMHQAVRYCGGPEDVRDVDDSSSMYESDEEDGENQGMSWWQASRIGRNKSMT
ncbi:hypothetical protein C8R43DRAFT_1111365 [Mycena crocata]|nr:hypothetical protein C8R43DRAFT_1111365 [Mycena crocata]